MTGRGAKAAPIWRRSLSAHEASHAVMAYRYRQAIGPRGVWIARPGVGETDVGPLCKAKPPRNGKRREAWKRRARAEVVSLLAGPVAEWMALGRPVNSKFRPRGADPDSDLRRVDRYLAELAGADGTGAEQWRLQERTKRLLCHPRTWRGILAVAEKLAETGSVRGYQAYAIFRANRVPRARRL
jgi:hypothetical protein